MASYTSPHFDLFTDPPKDESTTEYEYIEYLPRNSNDMNKDQHIIETKDLDEYLLPHKALLEVRGRLVKAADGSNYDPDDVITLSNNGWSLFKTVEYQLDNNMVERVDSHVPQASTILNLVQFSDDYGRSSATNMLWYKDTGTGQASPNEFRDSGVLLPVNPITDVTALTGKNFRDNFQTGALKNPAYNTGFRARQLITTGNKDTTMLLPLSSLLGFCKDIDTVFMGVKHTLNLTRESSANYIHRANGVDPGRFDIKHLSLWIPKVRPSLQLASKIESKLVKSTLRDLYFEQVRVYRNQYGSTETNPSWRVATHSNEELPTHIFFAIQAVNRSGNEEQNNQVFDNADLRSLSVYINSDRFPERDLDMNFSPATRNYTRAYMLFQEAIQKYADTDSGSQVSVEDFASLYTIIHVDVSKHKEKLRNSSADIELRWRLGKPFEFPTGTAASYQTICLILSERHLKLNGMNGKMSVVV
ncbi:uncharacterized protein LOC135824369 [Sycon ciliatum]|uniref:uncharacterized protein LOC135824369 n=1 Tax=Sycon ciliatum TaxID=27933 RepID=UPI0031F6CCA8